MLQKIERFVLKKLSKLPKKANYEAKDFYPIQVTKYYVLWNLLKVKVI